MFFKKKTSIHGVFATRYPERIIIETVNTSGPGAWHGNSDLSIVPDSISDKELGDLIQAHLSRSHSESLTKEIHRDYRNAFKKKTGLTSEAAILRDARHVSIYQEGKKIRLEPKDNRSDKKAHYGLPDAVSTCDTSIDPEILGRELRLAWDRCIFT